MSKVILTLKYGTYEISNEYTDLEVAAKEMYYRKSSAPFVTLHNDDTGEILWSTEHGKDTHRVSYMDEALGFLAKSSRGR